MQADLGVPVADSNPVGATGTVRAFARGGPFNVAADRAGIYFIEMKGVPAVQTDLNTGFRCIYK